LSIEKTDRKGKRTRRVFPLCVNDVSVRKQDRLVLLLTLNLGLNKRLEVVVVCFELDERFRVVLDLLDGESGRLDVLLQVVHRDVLRCGLCSIIRLLDRVLTAFLQCDRQFVLELLLAFKVGVDLLPLLVDVGVGEADRKAEGIGELQRSMGRSRSGGGRRGSRRTTSVCRHLRARDHGWARRLRWKDGARCNDDGKGTNQTVLLLLPLLDPVLLFELLDIGDGDTDSAESCSSEMGAESVLVSPKREKRIRLTFLDPFFRRLHLRQVSFRIERAVIDVLDENSDSGEGGNDDGAAGKGGVERKVLQLLLQNAGRILVIRGADPELYVL
jgi:hypothetical protein